MNDAEIVAEFCMALKEHVDAAKEIEAKLTVEGVHRLFAAQKRVKALTSGSGQRCIHCDTPITSLEQIGRCVYARPCNCRQYQGRLPKREASE